MTSEFDVTDVLQNGTNTVAVLVMKWCDGSVSYTHLDVYKRQVKHGTVFKQQGTIR